MRLAAITAITLEDLKKIGKLRFDVMVTYAAPSLTATSLPP